MTNICIVYTHHKLGDLIWQLPYIKAISEHHKQKVDLIVRKKTQAKNILKDLDHINLINYNDFRKGLYYWIDVAKLMIIYKHNKYTHVYILDKVNKPAIAAKLCVCVCVCVCVRTCVREQYQIKKLVHCGHYCQQGW